jgi:HlyD family secretion protein
LIIPNRAVFVEDGQQYVNVAVNGDETKLEKRAVTCGLSNGTETEVMEGLNVGEIVVIRGVSYS